GVTGTLIAPMNTTSKSALATIGATSIETTVKFETPTAEDLGFANAPPHKPVHRPLGCP
ncbi:hypothetical protein HAX54_007371, partial [Datura stramonium]|nr:hypothetical protein [Datura stramonium]